MRRGDCWPQSPDTGVRLGEAPAERMLAEAQQVLPTPAGRRAVLLTLRRAPDPPQGATVADRMPPPAPTERTPQ